MTDHKLYCFMCRKWFVDDGTAYEITSRTPEGEVMAYDCCWPCQRELFKKARTTEQAAGRT